MAYRFNLEDPIEHNVRRIALEQIDRALAPSGAGDAIWVHETRKSLKRIRALLRLVRTGLAETEWRRRNDELRDIAQSLSGKRDSDVRRALIAELEKDAKTKLAAALKALSDHDKRLADSQLADPSTGGDNATIAINAAKARLKKVRRLMARTKISNDFAHVVSGLAATHRRGRKWLELVTSEPTDEDFHELRKAVQIHWRQMSLLADVWPAVLQLRAGAAKEIAQWLGTEHDLSMLQQYIDALPGDTLSKSELAAVRSACLARQATLRKNSIAESERLFAQKPKHFADEIGTYRQLMATSAGDASS